MILLLRELGLLLIDYVDSHSKTLSIWYASVRQICEYSLYNQSTISIMYMISEET